ncbi:MAG: hypothetical protein HY873_14755 [Chloroflexi bacterium]|nr:hypothetical protein [Chloroflexota bacterium]
MAVAATQITLFERPEPRARSVVLRAVARQVPLLAIIGLVIGINVPTMHYYFFGDDFLVLGDIRSRSFPDYMRDVVYLRDMTPNWRPLTMLVYWGEYRLFGLDAMPWRIVNLAFHIGTVVVLYAFVLALTRRVFVALAAAMVFAVSASAVHTVTYITAFPHVFSQFLLMSALLAMHAYVARGERRIGWYFLSLTLFIAGFLANEGGVVLGAAIIAYYALYSLAKRRDVLDFALKMTPFVLSGVLLVGGLTGCGCQGVDGGFYGVGMHIPLETFVYMSRLAYPVGEIGLRPSAMEWAWGSVVLGFAIFFAIRGPNVARIAAFAMVIAVMPYVPGKIWTATRYSYMATPFFAVLVAVAAGFVFHYATRLWKPGAYALGALAIAAVGGLYSWQTIHQTEPFLKETDRWELLAHDLRANYESVPRGSTVYVIDEEGTWSNPFWQPTWMTSVGIALYGPDVKVRALPATHFEALKKSLPNQTVFYVVELDDGHLVRVPDQTATR